MKQYKHIIFDLDHTLWDFNTNSTETLKELFISYNLASLLNCDDSQFIDYYLEVNTQLWHLYNQHKVTKDELRTKRFELVLAHFHVFDKNIAQKLDRDYIAICPEKTGLIDGTLDILQHLQAKHTLHILTNGFKETQFRKLKACNILQYFDKIVTSECSGHNKPHRKMFSYALNEINASYKECIMIGDNLKTDIQGAKNIGMDHVFFNPHQIRHQFKVLHEVKTLHDLKNIL